ncbi:arabinan endo-1,5-alpha-L-arabinosidase [Actinospica durhamensis]|uniref:Arabinan endo-1,5-alpha-L-arabinosidase n=1 Tax=Actinospica durhamensis TaxID=1508375 RepID=A0A941IVP2_9ACTN|nr:arabinan endo-1,5-alpha-L-arabinosidase [Actinospica durhamensis]MBR7837551.1 arabinan endo-1,5-alpha-L-arabinosidase [Actinospica durhamensis]
MTTNPRRRGNASITRGPRSSLVLLLLVLIAAVLSAGGAGAAGYPNPETISGSTYAHDPSMVKTSSGRYYLFYTGGGIEMSTSTDRVSWSSDGQVLASGATWATAYGGYDDLWAPDVSYHNGVYWLYYAVSSFGSNVSAIGLATSTTAAPGSWTDHGLVYASQSSSDYNAIDPALLVDTSGHWWLSFGSFWSGVKMIQIDPSTGKQLASNTTRYSISERPSPDAEEASYVYPHGGYYYLFTSFDYCCRGTSSTYRIMVSRATSPTGPYTDESGVAATAGGGTQILGTHGYVIGPGGQSILSDTDGDVLVYHYYSGNLNGTAQLGLNHLSWGSNGWPTVVS